MSSSRNQFNSCEVRCRDLARLLTLLRTRHEELLEAVQEQAEALARADRERMRAAGERIQSLVQGIAVQDGLRRQLMDALGRDLGLEARRGRELTVAQLAQRLSGAARAALESAAEPLREVVGRVARANRRSAGVVAGVLGHLREVFAAIGRGCEPGGCYSGRGLGVTAPGLGILETVG